MSQCNKCNNSITDVNAKFCDKCGEFLELSGKEIRFKGNISTKKLKEFKKILIEVSSHHMLYASAVFLVV